MSCRKSNKFRGQVLLKSVTSLHFNLYETNFPLICKPGHLPDGNTSVIIMQTQYRGSSKENRAEKNWENEKM